MSKTGFINIDCGIPDNSSYKDIGYSSSGIGSSSGVGIDYVSDSGFIIVDENMYIIHVHRTTMLPQHFLIVRSFPRGIRNCYTLKPAQGPGNRYLIRAYFMYINYDYKDQLPQFDIHLGVEK